MHPEKVKVHIQREKKIIQKKWIFNGYPLKIQNLRILLKKQASKKLTEILTDGGLL